jgi:hypothetical protein
VSKETHLQDVTINVGSVKPVCSWPGERIEAGEKALISARATASSASQQASDAAREHIVARSDPPVWRLAQGLFFE